ncbi:MAG: zinc transporter ZupT [Thermodesulfobacteriota bacterium]
MEFTTTIWIALGLTLLAGLATTVGSFIGIIYREPGPRYMAFTLGFSAGVMVFVSFMELLKQAVDSIGFLEANVAFFVGVLVMFVIDLVMPHLYILEDQHGVGHTKDSKESKESKLKRTSVLVAIGIGIHNFPEGMATLAGTLKDIDVGIAMAIAIAIHNIPEGIAVAIPVYAATKSVGKAFKWSFISGLSEPVGALIAVLILMPFLNDTVIGWLLAVVAGFMVFISFDELLPVAHSYGREHIAILGVTSGMLVMSVSLVLLI